MAKVKTSDKVAYTPRKSDIILALTNGIVIGTVEAVEENGILLNDGTTTALVSNNPRRFKKLPADKVVTTVTKSGDKNAVSIVRKPGEKTVTVTKTTKTPRPGSKKRRAIEIYQEVNGDRTENLDRTTVKARFETELELGEKGSSTYYQNIKSRKNGWWV